MYYLVFILLCLLFGYCGYVQNAIVKDRKTQYFFRVCLIILLSYNVALFSENSNDHIGYVDMYNDINNVLIQFDDFGNLFSDRHTGMEIGYLLLNKLFHSLGFTADGFLLFVSILTNTLFVLALYKFNKYPLFCILSFLSTGVYLQESNLVRQCLAISMFIYSVPWILDQKSLWKYVMFIICAGLIHTSALLMIPLAAFKYIDIDKYHYKISYYLMIFWIMSIAVKIGIIDINFLLDKISFLSYYDMYLVTENNVGIGDMTLYALLYDLCVLVYFLTFEYNKKVIYLYSIPLLSGEKFSDKVLTV